MANKLKNYLKKNLLVLVLLLTAMTKVLEWTAQYIISRSSGITLSQLLSPRLMVSQLIFILTVVAILFWFFNFIKAKKKTFLLIPVLAYFIKEVYNFLFIYGRVLNSVTLTALMLEPLVLYGFIFFVINKYWLKIK